MEQRQEKEHFLMGEEQSAKSVMHMVCSLQCSGLESLNLKLNFISFEFQANATLALLEKITEEDKVARCFSRSPLSLRAAAAVRLYSLWISFI